MPDWMLYYVRHIPTREYARFKHTLRIINKVSKELIDQKSEDLLTDDKSDKDVISILGELE